MTAGELARIAGAAPHLPHGTQLLEAASAMQGVVEDLEALYAVGRELAAGDRWPNWYEGNPFKAARDRMMADKDGAAAHAGH